MRENLLMRNCCYEIVPTSFGWIGVIGNENSISRVTLPVESYMLAFRHLNLAVSQLPMKDVYGFVRETSLKIQRYISGENTVFDEEVKVSGTEFQIKAWHLIRSIPVGETKSYSWVADSIGHPGAARALGQAMKNNPIPIIIPCHRVIGKNGTIGGYGGTNNGFIKSSLINLEKSFLNVKEFN